PFRKFVGVGDFVADLEEKIDILDRAGEVPVGFYVVARLMIVFQIVFVGAERSVFRSREKMLVLADVERRQTSFAEFKIVCAINAAFLGERIWNHLPALSLRGSGKHVVQI